MTEELIAAISDVAAEVTVVLAGIVISYVAAKLGVQVGEEVRLKTLLLEEGQAARVVRSAVKTGVNSALMRTEDAVTVRKLATDHVLGDGARDSVQTLGMTYEGIQALIEAELFRRQRSGEDGDDFPRG